MNAPATHDSTPATREDPYNGLASRGRTSHMGDIQDLDGVFPPVHTHSQGTRALYNFAVHQSGGQQLRGDTEA